MDTERERSGAGGFIFCYRWVAWVASLRAVRVMLEGTSCVLSMTRDHSRIAQ